MSLQPGINPLDKRVPVLGRNPYRIGGRPPFVKDGPVYGPGPGQHYSFPNYGPHNRPHYGPDGREIPALTEQWGPRFPTRDISAEEAMRKRTGPQKLPGFKTLEYRYGRDESPLRTLEYVPSRDKSELQLLGGSPVWGPGPGEMHRYQNTGGFDATDLMAKPEIKQEETRNQANMVSAPYEEANRKAAEKTNPMNAASQEPGMAFLMKYVGK